ncbi:MAG: acetylxylan esterase, partial [Chthoniobacteraceae bacterium]
MISASLATDFPTPAELPVRAELPDLLVMMDGTKITTREDWETKRKPELRELIQTYEYGRIPAGPKKLTFETLAENPMAFGGKATLREVAIRWEDGEFALLIAIPNQRTKPAPCFVGLNFNGNHAVVDDPLVRIPDGERAAKVARGQEAEAWSIEQSIDRGYAVAVFYNSEVVPDDKGAAFQRLKAFLPEGMNAEAPDAPATIACWAWGFMRALDCLEKQPEIDGKRIAVVGHSRNGKTAILAAAMDDRIALAIPSQAGCGGTAPCRLNPELAKIQANGRTIAETVKRINTSFPHWFDTNFKAFNDEVEKLPFDQHALIALCAPRPVLVSNATEDLWANPAGQFDMVRAADPVYRLVAGEGCAAKEMPPGLCSTMPAAVV